MAEQFQQVTGNGIQPDDPRYDDPENPENREFSTFETTYDGAYDSEGNPDPENRDDQDFSWESETESSTSIVKKLGANQDVIDGLSHVTFVTGCEMSDAIAYIRYWSRSGVTPKTTVTPEQAYTLPSDVSKELGDALGDMYRLPEDFNTSYSLPENFNYSDSFNYAAESNKITLTVPENTAYQSRPRQPVPTRQPSLPTLDFKAGEVFSANPSGIVQGSTSAAPSDAVWHFLFNPEELQLSSGPEYNKAETWGVSDPANSGQPLSWRNNRNRKLTFNKVLLHGYSFGKRVDSLEKGLQDLFMAREGEGSDGPPVLEFVWGKRHFGPCVIQNIQVREKAWDKGLLVNAEVSFDLEQVPEWTINDGFVDVLRPGRQPLINDPVLPPSTQAAGASPEDEESKKNDDKKTPDGSKPPTGLPKEREKNLRITQGKCSLSEETYKSLLKTRDNVSKLRRNAAGTSADKTRSYRQSIKGYIDLYGRLIVRLKNSTPGASRLNKIYGASEIEKSVNQYFLSNTNSPDIAKNKSVDLLTRAIEQSSELAKSYYTSETCTRIDGELKRIQDSRKSANEKLFLSRAIQENNSCSIGAGNTITNPNTGKVYRCEIKDRDPTITVYREIK